MFHTFPEAERRLPAVLAPHGQRAWEWIELAIPHMAHLMVTLSWREGEDDWLSRRFVFARLAEALDFLRQHEKDMDKVRLDVLRTAGDGESPELHPIHEVWGDGQSFVFVTPSKARLLEPPHATPRADHLACVWAMRPSQGPARRQAALELPAGVCEAAPTRRARAKG